MRTALRCPARLSVASHTTLYSPTWKRAAYQRIQKDVSTSKQFLRFASSGLRYGKHMRSRLEKIQEIGRLKITELKDPQSFATLYDTFLPKYLRIGDSAAPDYSRDLPLSDLLVVRECAQRAANVDLWEWMVHNGYRKQLVWLVNTGLRYVASRTPQQNNSPPSNIQWPENVLHDLHFSEKALTELGFAHVKAPSLEQETGPKRSVGSDNANIAFIRAVWLTLARLVISAGETQPVQSQSSMTTVLLILAHIHNLDMIPPDIYTYRPLTSSSTIARPPILHLVYSRILASLSDATWRDLQDDAIAQASQLGHTSKFISENVPGGRFRLKVQGLPTEIWLELILWCCVDGSHLTVASEIVKMINRSDNPWFAVRWCSTQASPVAETLVDWNRVKLRHGGTVGLIEGYSHDKPFVDVPKNTISVEVVLALVENYAANNAQNLSKLEKISDLLQFLEPHDLPPSYFDYLESKLIHAGLLDKIKDPSQAQECSEKFNFLRSLKPIKEVPRAVQTLELDSVLDHSLSRLGIMHQMLDMAICHSGVHNALELFNDIQEEIDRNKSQSIMEFLQVPLDEGMGVSSTTNQTHPYRLEYADSHGQLPYHQLASFLDLATEARMLGLGEWLLYSDDLDEALIPSSAYSRKCLAPSLIRYTSVNHDDALLALINGGLDSLLATTGVRPSVRIHRAFFDAEIDKLDLVRAAYHLRVLKKRSARVGLSNYAHLSALILRLEKGDVASTDMSSMSKRVLKQSAIDMMEWMLSGDFNRSDSSQTPSSKIQYRQQISHILRVFAQCENSILADLAEKYAIRYASGNKFLLPTRVFNLLLDGVVKAYGPEKGRDMYELFCGDLSPDMLTPEQLDDDAADFRDPIVDAKSQAAKQEASTTESSEDFSNSFFPASADRSEAPIADMLQPIRAASRFLRPIHIAIPQASTLRVILRATLSQNPNNDHLISSISDWAVARFDSIGTKSLNIISQEIQRPLAEVDLVKSRKLLYQLSDDNRSRYNATIRQRYTEKRREDEEQSLWASQVPSFSMN